MKHWRIVDVPWDRFDRTKLDPEIVALVKAAAMVERNGIDYGTYLNRVFVDDPDLRAAADRWSLEEVQHGDTLGRWAMLADPSWSFEDAFARYKSGYHLPLLDADTSVRGSRTGELIARCMVETGTSSYYSALADSAQEPVLKEICRLIAADEFRHFKLFYDHLKRYLKRERIGVWRRVMIAAGRIGESEDDELAYAFHCGNTPADAPYTHKQAIAGYMSRAMTVYTYGHMARATSMIMKAVGLPPRGKLYALAARAAWWLMCNRRAKFTRVRGLGV
jgi:rubrerythrin